MGTDKYKVEILHYIHPHLIWALVEKGGEENSCFEQIGIYGLLPLDVVIDVDGDVYTKRCEDWVPAVYQAMMDILSAASEVWFSVTFTDRTTSIFDDNIHKYGYLTIKMKDGTTVSLLQKLLDTGLVAEDLQYFHQNLNTKLDYVQTTDVVRKIKHSLKYLGYPSKYSENLLMKQLTIYQKTVELEETTPRSLDFHLRDNHIQLIQKQISNLSVCKDVDEVSAGRANTVSKENSTVSGGLPAKPKSGRFIKIKCDVMSTITTNKTTKSSNYRLDMKNEDEAQEQIPIKNTRGKNTKAKDANRDKNFAIGPPGLNPTQFHFMERPKEQPKVKEVTEIKDPENDEDKDMFENTDSELNIKISDLDVSKLKITPNVDTKSNIVKHSNIVENISNSNKNSNVNNTTKCAEENVQNVNANVQKPALSSIQRKMMFLKEKMAIMNDSSSTADTDSAVKQGDDSDNESITALVDKLDISQGTIKTDDSKEPELIATAIQNNVNPFKNLECSKSVFVEKLISPTLMVHTKKGNCIQPVSNLRDIPFGTAIHKTLKNMCVRKPMRPQTVSWPTILRGHSLFLVSPFDSGKTLGYLPAVCRLVSDSKDTAAGLSVARLTCIIVCATAYSVSNVEDLCKIFLHEASIFACYIGMTDIDISAAILNGCDILITTPTMLVRLMRKESFGLDLRNLKTFVIDDCERISEVYQIELKFCLHKIREMLKGRVNNEVKVQYVVASRIWCSFMSSLAKKAPDSVVCIGAFQECVLYSEVNTSVEFLEKEQKILSMVRFLKDIDKSNKTVIVCRSDDEVHLVEKTLTMLKFIVFACDSTMTIQDLYSIDLALSEYEEPIIGPILVCCDGNLTHLNVTDAHYLIHFSLPRLFSMFCKRFAVLIDNYSSIFDSQNSDVKIKIFVEKSNVDQLPKILHFIKRCSDNVPPVLDKICSAVMLERDLSKAQNLTPPCATLLTLGKCVEMFNCPQRHAIFKDQDEPAAWLPREGIITFKILHYHSAVNYSARMISCTTNNDTKKYPQTYSLMSIKLGMYYSRESNRKLHGVAEIGDVCAVSLKHNLFARCRVVKILKHTRNNIPSLMLINLIDEERYEMAKDTCLYYLPDYLKKIESHVVRVVLANLAPQDKDITYSKLAEEQLKGITERNEEIFMRGQVSLVIGNCIFVETLEACQTLSSMNETVVKSNFRNELLENYAVNNPNHIRDLQKLGEHLDFMQRVETVQNIEIPKPIKVLPEPSWAHLESDNPTAVYYLYAKTPELFFVQHIKFQDCINILLKDIKDYVSDNPEPVNEVNEGDIVLAEFPDNSKYERARIDSKIVNNKVKCFFVDLGDWRIVSINKLLSITGQIITQLPFQAIECRLVGIKPLGDVWSEFSTNWLVDQFYDSSTNLKYLFAKRFTKETAEFTGGAKYGIALIDTYADDVCINKLMLDANLAQLNDEIEFLDTINDNNKKEALSDAENDEEILIETVENTEVSTHEPIEGLIPSSISMNSKDREASTLVESELPTLCKEVDKKGKNGISTQKIPSLEPNDDIQQALMHAFSQEASASNAGTVSSRDLILHSNQRAAMNSLRSQPIRSVPLVDSDDFDDDRWDSENAVLMLLANKCSSVVSEESSSKKNESKIRPLAISASKSEIKGKPVTDIDQQAKIPLSSDGTAGLHNIESVSNTKADECKAVSQTKSTADQLESTFSSMQENSDKHSNLNWTVSESDNTVLLYDNDRKFQIIWSQNSNTVNIEIQIKIEKYGLIIKDKHILFYTNDIEFGFELELYGVVDIKNSTHFNRGSHIEIKLRKLMCKKWLHMHIGDVKKLIDKTTNITDKDDSSKATAKPVTEAESPEELLRKPRVVWRQNKTKVTIKILLITEKYDLVIKDKHIKFYANANDEEYGFEFELYGVVDVSKSSHSYKGQYIQINLIKIMSRNWLTLSKGHKFWVVYDADNIDVSSDDEVESTNEIANLKHNLKVNLESESDDDFNDDYDFAYK